MILNQPEIEEVLQEGAETEETNPFGVLATPEIKLPPRPPEVHQGKILNVTSESFDSGAHAAVFTLASKDVPNYETKLFVWVPQVAFDNPRITAVEIGKLPAEEGKKKTPQEQWGQAKQVIEESLRIALAQGREIPRDVAWASFEEYISLVDGVCAGIDIVFKLTVDKNPSEPRYASTLKPRGIYDPEAAMNPRLFKGVIKRWEAAEAES